MAIELATAYVNIVPSTRDLAGGIAKDLIPGAEQAGDQAGAAAGKSMAGGLNSSISKFLGPAVVAGAAVGIGKALLDIGGTFDDLSDTIRTNTGASGAALDGLVDSAKNVGAIVPVEIGSIGPVIADLSTRLGLTGTDLETVAAQYLEAGRILGQEVDITATTAAFNAFKIEGADVTEAMDDLFRISQATGVGMNELAAAAQKNAPALQELGFSFEESAVMAGWLDKAGLNAGQTMTALGKGMVTLAKEGEAPQDAFWRTKEEIQGFIESGDRAAALDLAAKIFGTKGAAQFVAAVEEGTFSSDAMMDSIAATGDTILGVGQETADFAEQWQLVKNNAALALEPLGSAIFSGLGVVIDGISASLQWMSDNSQIVTAVVGGLAAGLLYALAPSLWAAVTATWAWTVALLANPVTWIVIGIVALVAALIMLIQNWDGVVEWLKGVWAGMVTWLAGIWESIKLGVENAWNGIKDAIKIVVDWMVGIFLNWTLPGIIIKHWDSIKEGAVTAFTALVDWVRGLPQRILDALGNVDNLLKDAGRNIIDGFLDGLKESWNKVTDFIGGIGRWIADNKGPKAYDLALLVPAGGWIMEGLGDGLEAGLPGLRATLGGVSAEIAATNFATATSSYAATAPALTPTATGGMELSDATIARIVEGFIAGSRAVGEATARSTALYQRQGVMV